MPLSKFTKGNPAMSKTETDKKFDMLLVALDGLNMALWEREEVNEIEELIRILERELRVARKSVELLTA